jgi:hypothetical protein
MHKAKAIAPALVVPAAVAVVIASALIAYGLTFESEDDMTTTVNSFWDGLDEVYRELFEGISGSWVTEYLPGDGEYIKVFGLPIVLGEVVQDYVNTEYDVGVNDKVITNSVELDGTVQNEFIINGTTALASSILIYFGSTGIYAIISISPGETYFDLYFRTYRSDNSLLTSWVNTGIYHCYSQLDVDGDIHIMQYTLDGLGNEVLETDNGYADLISISRNEVIQQARVIGQAGIVDNESYAYANETTGAADIALPMGVSSVLDSDDAYSSLVGQTAGDLAQADANGVEVSETVIDVSSSIVTGLQDVFVPSQEVIQAKVQALMGVFEDRFGLLTYPVSVLFNFIDRMLEIGEQEPILSWNNINWQGVTIITAGQYNLNDAVSQGPQATVYSIYSIVVKAALVISFLGLCYKKYEKIVNGGWCSE